MGPEELKRRTKSFALRVIRVFKSLPRNDESRTLGKQLLRSGTSVAANYRAVCRSRPKAEFIARLGIVVEEIDETVLWLELLIESEILSATRLSDLLKEANELLAIFSTSQLTAKAFPPGALGKLCFKFVNSKIRRFANLESVVIIHTHAYFRTG
ncbi:MAG TPA: four helix bundle protein [Terriglobales bacterium]|jgi:four helix bundle protein